MLAGAVVTFVHNAGADQFGQNMTEVAGVVLVAVGGSLLATALVARLVATQVFGIDVSAALEALRGVSHLARANQCLTITLEVKNGEVVATGKHEFDLLSSSRLPQTRDLSLYTDVGDDGGFHSITEPDGTELTEDELKPPVDETEVTQDEPKRLGEREPLVRRLDGKVQFKKAYRLRPGTPSRFVIQTFGQYRCIDRLIWTVEHISRDFVVHIVDRRGVTDSLCVKINHHRRDDIVSNIQKHSDHQGTVEVTIDYLGEVLPYQGFELQWNE
jgi:hypothetical protein